MLVSKYELVPKKIDIFGNIIDVLESLTGDIVQ